MGVKTLSKFIFLLTFLSVSAHAQIVDDSTKLVYGPTSTRYITLKDIKHNDTLFHTMDTSLYNLENYHIKKRQDDYHYDLGNNGTAVTPIYFQIPKSIGRTTGFYVYDAYVKNVNDFRYYDTKSPYMELDLMIGGTGRNYVDFSFSRNVNPQFNFGMDVSRVASQKQLGGASLREKQVLGTGYDAYAYYHTKKRNYHVMFHAYRFEHSAVETGGILENTEERNYFQYLDAAINLRTAFTEDLRERFFLYQEFDVAPFLELYSMTKSNNVRNRFIDSSPTSNPNANYYDRFLIRSDSTNDASQMKEWDNQVGVKGRVIDRIYYSAYLRRRDLGFTYRFVEPVRHEAENYFGGDLKLWVTPTNTVGGSVELMDEGMYQLEGRFNNNFITARYITKRTLPPMMTQRYFGNHYEWNNNFGSIFTNSIQGSAQYEFPFVRLEPQVELTSLKNYIYFNENRIPEQNTGTMLINRYGLKADFSLGHFRLNNHIIYNDVAGINPDVMRIPNWNWFGRWYYENIVFGDQMEMQFGVDLRWQSAYFGKAYDPITQQFHLQNQLEVASYLTGDLFFIMKSFDVTLWVRVNYLNQARDKGYFEVPYYPGMRRVVDLGVRWMFFE